MNTRIDDDSTVLTSRVARETAQSLREAAQREGKSVNKYLRQIIENNVRITPAAQATLERFMGSYSMRGDQVIETLVIAWGALLDAYGYIHKDPPLWLTPLYVDTEGKRLEGTDLYLFLIERYIKALETDERLQRQAMEEFSVAKMEADQKAREAYTQQRDN